jgi:hypothetical protein
MQYSALLALAALLAMIWVVGCGDLESPSGPTKDLAERPAGVELERRQPIIPEEVKRSATQPEKADRIKPPGMPWWHPYPIPPEKIRPLNPKLPSK